MGQAGIANVDIDAPEAWEVSTRPSITVVGVIDTGVDYNHPDLAANIWSTPRLQRDSVVPTINCPRGRLASNFHQ